MIQPHLPWVTFTKTGFAVREFHKLRSAHAYPSSRLFPAWTGECRMSHAAWVVALPALAQTARVGSGNVGSTRLRSFCPTDWRVGLCTLKKKNNKKKIKSKGRNFSENNTDIFWLELGAEVSGEITRPCQVCAKSEFRIDQNLLINIRIFKNN